MKIDTNELGHMTNMATMPGLSISEIWGRNSAPFPKPKSMFFSQFKMKNSQSDQVCLVQENCRCSNKIY